MEIIDAKDAVLGRLATQVAQLANSGEEVRILNAEQVIISGDKKMVLTKYQERADKGSRYKGPFTQRRPDLFVKRAIRGMLPKGTKGRDALKRIRAYIGVPDELKDKGAKPAIKDIRNLGTLKYITVKELCSKLGWKSC